MQKKARTPTSPMLASDIPLVSVASGEESNSSLNSVSNDNSKPSTEGAESAPLRPKPKVFMSPKKAAAKSLAEKKKPLSNLGLNTKEIPFGKKQDSNIPRLTSATTVTQAPATEAVEDVLLPPKETLKQRPSVLFDVKFALGLIAIVVSVNLLLALLIDNKPKQKEMAAKPVAPAESITQSREQGSVVYNAPEQPLRELAPSSGSATPALTIDTKPMSANATAVEPLKPVAPTKPVVAATPELGVVTTDADNKRKPRDMLSIISQY